MQECRPMSGLVSKLSDMEAFEATPAGAALKRLRGCTLALLLIDEATNPDGWDRARNEVRRAERELIAEIKRLQERAA